MSGGGLRRRLEIVYSMLQAGELDELGKQSSQYLKAEAQLAVRVLPGNFGLVGLLWTW